jgi:hemerythrin-like domain-containing protein
MKRHPALIQHSREHHQALKLARLARFAVDSGSPEAIKQAAETLREQFPNTLETHFCDEEQGLLVQLAAIGQHALVQRTLDEHARLRALNDSLKNPDAATMATFASLLHDHVRFEERELFETAQALLYPEEASPSLTASDD